MTTPYSITSYWGNPALPADHVIGTRPCYVARPLDWAPSTSSGPDTVSQTLSLVYFFFFAPGGVGGRKGCCEPIGQSTAGMGEKPF